MRRHKIVTTSLFPSMISQMTTSRRVKNAKVLDIVYDVCACVLALLFGAVLMKLLRDYTRRKGYIEIQQDDRGMYSRVLMATSDSWEHVSVVTHDAAV
ncbi:unnamed protein product [Peronospora effusa]|nr:unnamed protein product [Peronospora effusa]